MTTSFSIANINPGLVRAEFMASIMGLMQFEHRQGGVGDVHFGQYYSRHAGPYLDTERNACVEWFMNQTISDYLLFVDSDISFDPQQAYELIAIAERGEPHLQRLTLLGGVYYNGLSGSISPLAYRWAHDESLGQRNLFPLPQAAIESMSTLTDHAPVDGMGAGFMLIHRYLLEEMRKVFDAPTPWFAELSIDGIQMGEDFTFCCRAASIGHQPYIAPRIILPHYKVCRLAPAPNHTAQVSATPADNGSQLQEVQ